MNSKANEQIISEETKISHLTKVKGDIEQALDDTEENLEKEKKLRFEVESNRLESN